MPRKKQTLSIEQINEFLDRKESPETRLAVEDFLQAEKQRRIDSGKVGGRKKVYEGDEKTRNRLAAKKYYEKKKHGR